MHPSPLAKSSTTFGARVRNAATRLFREIEQSPVGCYSIGEFYVPLAEQQRQPDRSSERSG
ncbi:MAG: hypothetical protein ABWY93_28690 [Mycobacterium sp.]